jgi:hypothetical protein
MSGARTAALVCGTAHGGALGAGLPSAGEAAAAGTVGADTGEVLLAAVVPVVCGLLPSPPPPPPSLPAVVPAPGVAEVLVPSLPVFVLSEASAPVVPVVAVPVVCEPLSALDVEPSELVPLVVVFLLMPLAVIVVLLLLLVLVLVCVVPVSVSVPAEDAGSAVAGPGVGGTVVAVASAAAAGSLTGAVGSSPVTAVPAVAVVAADAV